jgi:hypothetical protein
MLMPNTSTCQGTATLWSTHKSFPGPKDQPFQFDSSFDLATGRWEVSQFTPIVIEDIDTPIGRAKLTVALLPPTEGSWEVATGAMAVTARFRFKFDKPIIGTSILAIVLDTHTAQGPPPQAVQGTPLDAATGSVSLAGIGTFTGGTLNGVKCAIQLKGTFAPPPHAEPLVRGT